MLLKNNLNINDSQNISASNSSLSATLNVENKSASMILKVADNQDKASIKRFYKRNNYSASYMGHDTCYIVESGLNKPNKKNEKSELLAAVIVSAIKEDSRQFLLHALVIDESFRRQKLASDILASELFRSTNQQDLVCFAESNLEPFYIGLGFKVIQENGLESHLQQRYQSYKKKRPSLLVFFQRAFVT